MFKMVFIITTVVLVTVTLVLIGLLLLRTAFASL